MERQFAIGIAGFALVIGALAIAGEVDSGNGPKPAGKPNATANLRLAKLSTADRRDVGGEIGEVGHGGRSMRQEEWK